jgi:hypothetical protein
VWPCHLDEFQQRVPVDLVLLHVRRVLPEVDVPQPGGDLRKPLRQPLIDA